MAPTSPASPTRSPEGFIALSEALCSMAAPHSHSEVEFSLILEGSQIGVIGGKAFKQSKGDLVLFWAAVPHRPLAVVANGRFVLVEIPLPWFMNCRLPVSFPEWVLKGNVLIEPSHDVYQDASAFERWRRDIHARDPELRDIALSEIQLRLRRIAAEHALPGASEGKLIQQDRDSTVTMIRFITKKFHETITVADITAAADLSPNYGAMIFRNVWHMSLTSFVTRYRLMEAQRLLATTDHKILDVALRSGFGSVSQFYAEFHKAFGYPPGVCRQALTHNAEPGKAGTKGAPHPLQ